MRVAKSLNLVTRLKREGAQKDPGAIVFTRPTPNHHDQFPATQGDQGQSTAPARPADWQTGKSNFTNQCNQVKSWRAYLSKTAGDQLHILLIISQFGLILSSKKLPAARGDKSCQISLPAQQQMWKLNFRSHYSVTGGSAVLSGTKAQLWCPLFPPLGWAES